MSDFAARVVAAVEARVDRVTDGMSATDRATLVRCALEAFVAARTAAMALAALRGNLQPSGQEVDMAVACAAIGAGAWAEEFAREPETRVSQPQSATYRGEPRRPGEAGEAETPVGMRLGDEAATPVDPRRPPKA